MTPPPPASIVIPTRARLPYLEVALSSIAPQALAAAAEVLVVDDAGPSHAARALAERFGARYEPHREPLGLNVARNTGVARSSGELVAFVDDDIEAAPDWLAALIAAAEQHPDVEVFTGPIKPRLEGRAPHSCGREGPPITALDLGVEDTPTRWAWGTNMAVRRSALKRIGPFDTSLEHGGDEQEWQERLAGPETERERPLPVLYVARAAVWHRRAGADARLGALARVAYARGRAARRFDARRGRQPSLAEEIATLARCGGHVVRRRCPAALTTVSHSAGRAREGMRETFGRRRSDRPAGEASTPQPPPVDDFLSGSSGTVGGLDSLRRGIVDGAVDGWELISGRRSRLRRAARSQPARRRVLVLGVERPEHAASARAARAELLRSRHEVEVHMAPVGGRGKFENVNRLLGEHPAAGHDWLLVVDDDVELPRGFLDRFLFLCERFRLQLAQPAHRLDSHAAWSQTRRRRASVAREMCFVEIGPVTAFVSATFPVLLPFPDLRMGWGLDAHWSALAREHGWRCGVIDAVAIRHRAPAADAYSQRAAVAEARAFLAGRPYVSAAEARRTLTTYRHW